MRQTKSIDNSSWWCSSSCCTTHLDQLLNLRRNPPEVRVTSLTSLVYLHRNAKFCATIWNVSSQKKSFRTTPNVKTLESTVQMKLMMKFFQCLHNFSEFWSLFSRVPLGNCFRWYFSQLLSCISVYKKCIYIWKGRVKYLKFFWRKLFWNKVFVFFPASDILTFVLTLTWSIPLLHDLACKGM